MHAWIYMIKPIEAYVDYVPQTYIPIVFTTWTEYVPATHEFLCYLQFVAVTTNSIKSQYKMCYKKPSVF